jgi:hypothetical protein
MAVPQTFLAYAPRGAGLMCAVAYIEVGQDVYGWYIGHKEGAFPCAYFKLEDFFSTAGNTFLATDWCDIYAGWKFNYASSQPKFDKAVPVDQDIIHKLVKLQDDFVGEWLFFSDDPGTQREIEAYRHSELPLQTVNIKTARLNRLNKDQPVWKYYSKEFETKILDYLMRRWPLEYGRE